MSSNNGEIETSYITVGKIGAPYGIRGWVKVHSFTDPADNLLDYEPWYLESQHSTGKNTDARIWSKASLTEAKTHGKGFIARFDGCDDRDAAASMNGLEIAIRRDQLPETEEGEYYWADLEGLEVKTLDDISLGKVESIEATGANDVLIIKGKRERLIPYVMGHIVHEVNTKEGYIRVDWDPDFD